MYLSLSFLYPLLFFSVLDPGAINPHLKSLALCESFLFFVFCFLFFFFVFLPFLGLLPWHMEVPRPGVQLELQLPAIATATATQDPSRIYDLHHS